MKFFKYYSSFTAIIDDSIGLSLQNIAAKINLPNTIKVLKVVFSAPRRLCEPEEGGAECRQNLHEHRTSKVHARFDVEILPGLLRDQKTTLRTTFNINGVDDLQKRGSFPVHGQLLLDQSLLEESLRSHHPQQAPRPKGR